MSARLPAAAPRPGALVHRLGGTGARAVWGALALAALGCQDDSKGGPGLSTAPPAASRSWTVVAELGGEARSFDVDDGVLWAIVDGEILRSDDGQDWAPVTTAGLPPGAPTWIGAEDGTVLVDVPGAGLHRWDGAAWAPPSTPPPPGLIASLNPRALPVPWTLRSNGAGTLWIAAAGGAYASEDGGGTWRSVLFGAAGFNPLVASAAAQGDHVLAGAFAPRGLLPDFAASLVEVVLVESHDGGESWAEALGATDLRYVADLELADDGRLALAALDGGLHERVDGAWIASGGPSDALFVHHDPDGVSVGSASRGLWRREAGAWVGVGAAPMVGVEAGFALDRSGTVYRLDPGAGAASAPGDAGGTVHVALSFHGNLYHSYRGDENTDDGYGLDLEVMRATLDWLGRHPAVHADWDIENHFSLDGWMATDGADVVARIHDRVASGQDDVRPMSWNNGAMANHSREEFDASMSRAKASLDAAFGGHVPGVQPQECMFTPDHIGWYRDQGIDWITLFHSGTGFTAVRDELSLPAAGWYQPVTIVDPQAAADDPHRSMELVPVYHHADIINHGGLDGWVRQISETQPGDSLLVIHFDADAESWVNFERELEALEGEADVRFTTIQAYLDDHAPTVTVDAPLDVADGTGDGFQSWAEKDVNHEIATGIVRAREAAQQAEALAGDLPEVAARLEAALTPRLLALSTTHFGLAAPTLHPDRIASARAHVEEAETLAEDALSEAIAALDAPGAGEIWVHETRGLAGTALVTVPLALPAADWTGPDALHLVDEAGAELVAAVTVDDDTGDPVAVSVRLPLSLSPHATRQLRWELDARAPATGEARAEDSPMALLPVTLPFTECAGQRAEGTAEGPRATVDDRGAHAAETLDWSLDLCAGVGVDNLRWTARAWDGLPGVELEVEAVLPDATGGTATADAPWNLDAESVALSPLVCSSGADSLRWQTFSGSVRSRPVRPLQWGWNGQAVDAWITVVCSDDAPIQIAHAATERTSLAMLPLRNIDGQALVAPLGTLWGPPIRHDVRRTGGHGMGDVSTAVIGSQFRPAAPDWSGATVRYRLLVGDGSVDEGTLSLFAHPPLVRVGPAD